MAVTIRLVIVRLEKFLLFLAAKTKFKFSFEAIPKFPATAGYISRWLLHLMLYMV